MAGEKTINDITFRIRHTMMLVSDLDRSIVFTPACLEWTSSVFVLRRRKTRESAI
jgi:hypothetical protein